MRSENNHVWWGIYFLLDLRYRSRQYRGSTQLSDNGYRQRPSTSSRLTSALTGTAAINRSRDCRGPCLRKNEISILREQEAVRNEFRCGRTDLLHVRFVRGIALLQRGPRVASDQAFGFGAEERNEGADQIARITFTEAGLAYVPSRIGAERDLDGGVADAVGVIAVRIDLRQQQRIGRTDLRRLLHHACDIRLAESLAAIEMHTLCRNAARGKPVRRHIREFDMSEAHERLSREGRI